MRDWIRRAKICYRPWYGKRRKKKIDSLAEKLGSKKTNSNQQRYILECLKTIDTPEALDLVKKFIHQQTGDAASQSYASEMVMSSADKAPIVELFSKLPPSFRNYYEDRAEYIHIPGGEFKYSVTKKTETMQNTYFAKHPVTNRRYQRFTSFLEGKDAVLESILPLQVFHKKMSEFAGTIKNFPK